MAGFKQCVSWWCFVPDKMTPQALLKTAAEIGYQGVELVGSEYWPLVKDYGLNIASIIGGLSLTEGLNRPENWPKIERQIHDNLEQMVKWGIPNLIVFSGNRAGLDDVTGAQITADNLSRAAEAAASADVTIILELLNSKVDHPDYQCDTTPWGVEVCKQVNSPQVKLLYDIYHMQIMEGDLIRTIQDHHAWIGHYHTAGNPGRHEIDDSQEINYPAVMRAIAATDYAGWVGQEFIPTRDPVAGLRQAYQLCDV